MMAMTDECRECRKCGLLRFVLFPRFVLLLRMYTFGLCTIRACVRVVLEYHKTARELISIYLLYVLLYSQIHSHRATLASKLTRMLFSVFVCFSDFPVRIVHVSRVRVCERVTARVVRVVCLAAGHSVSIN